MSITIRCAECAESYQLSDDLAGKTIRCRECDAFVKVPKSESERKGEVVYDPDITPTKKRTDLRFLFDILSFVVWGLCVIWSAVWIVLFWGAAARKESTAIQEAAMAATVAAHIMAGYVTARAIETVLSRLTRWFSS